MVQSALVIWACLAEIGVLIWLGWIAIFFDMILEFSLLFRQMGLSNWEWWYWFGMAMVTLWHMQRSAPVLLLGLAEYEWSFWTAFGLLEMNFGIAFDIEGFCGS